MFLCNELPCVKKYNQDQDDELALTPLHCIERTIDRTMRPILTCSATVNDACLKLPQQRQLLDLTNDWSDKILSFLDVVDFAMMAQVNKDTNFHMKQVQVELAERCGYTLGCDSGEAQNYLKNFLQSIATLARDGFIPREYVIYRGFFPRYVSSVATLRNLPIVLNRRLRHLFDQALFTYVANRRTKVVRVLLYLGTDPNLRKASGDTALHYAVREIEAMKVLFRAGANPNLQNASGDTALHYAVMLREIEAIEVLLTAGTNPNLQNASGDTALHYAGILQERKAIEVLLRAGANPDIQNALGTTA
jgi:hypothetical protein